jgi:ribosomal protein S18 acetylase RimI-like enzyme
VEIGVEVAREDRWREVRAVRLAALADAPDAFLTTLDDERDRSEADWRQRLTRPRTSTILAVTDDEQRAGLTVVAPSFGDEVAGVYAVWVAPWARERGVGGALIERAAAEALRHGYRRAVLDVGDHNTAAQRLYARHGFTPTGRTSRFPPPREHISEHELARDLTV